jgi:hypothetical protein
MAHTHFDHLRVLLLGILLAFPCGVSVHAQIDRATVIGTVNDPSGAVVTGATIVTVEQDTGLRTETRSNSQGLWR